MSRTLVLATRNEHKVAELRQILADVCRDLGLEIVGVDAFPGVPDVPETEVTFLGNARLKAVAVTAATGLPAIADDSGLAVDVLGGCPGVFSARWSGSAAGPGATRQDIDRANLRLLLEQLADVPPDHRRAAFVCAAVLAVPGEDGQVAEGAEGGVIGVEGRVEGVLAHEPRGTYGFGYDPLFIPDVDPSRTLAEFSDAEKNAISHRGNAFRAMEPILRGQLRRLTEAAGGIGWRRAGSGDAVAASVAEGHLHFDVDGVAQP